MTRQGGGLLIGANAETRRRVFTRETPGISDPRDGRRLDGAGLGRDVPAAAFLRGPRRDQPRQRAADVEEAAPRVPGAGAQVVADKLF